MIEKIDSKLFLINMAALFLYCLGVVPDLVFAVYVISFLVYEAVFEKRVHIDRNVVVLFIALLIYSLMYRYYKPKKMPIPQILNVTVMPVLTYMWGRAVVIRDDIKRDHDCRIRYAILTATFGLFIHGALNVIYYLIYGYSQPTTRIWLDFFSHEEVYATQHMFYFFYVSALIFYAVYTIRKNVAVSIAIIICAAAGNIFFFFETTRTVFLETFLVLFIEIGLYVLLNVKNVKHLVIPLVVVAVVAFACYYILKHDMWGIKESMYYWVIFNRDGGVLGNERFVMQRHVLSEMVNFKHPLGGLKIDLGRMFHPHNSWLQFYYVGGFPALIPYLIFTIFTVSDAAKVILRKTTHSNMARYMIAALYAVTLIYYTVELPFNRTRLFFVFFTLVCGFCKGELLSVKEG